MEIRPLDVSDDRVLGMAHAVERAANEHARPGWQSMSVEARTLGWRADDGWDNRLVGAWGTETLVGFGAGMTSSDVPETAWIFAWVLPEYQHQGVGTALVRAVERNSPSMTTRSLTRAYRATVDDIAALEHRFLKPLGFDIATTETVLELDLRSVIPARLPVVDGYTVSSYVNGVPERFREQVGQIKGLVDAEAPNGELAWLESPVTVGEYVQEMDLWVAQGSTVIESIALDGDGSVAAWTCLVISAVESRPAQIEGTLVLTQHRGHGLGAAVKSASLDMAKALGTVQSVRTSSDDRNSWMRAINASLGFIPVEIETIFQKLSAPQ